MPMISINTSGTSGAKMVKRTIVSDDVMYVKYKESGLRQEYYFNRKGCDNEERGHFAIENGKVVCDRSAPALEIVLSGNSHFLCVSSSLVMSLN